MEHVTVVNNREWLYSHPEVLYQLIKEAQDLYKSHGAIVAPQDSRPIEPTKNN